MSSLWTPGGEHEVPREPRQQPQPAPAQDTPPQAGHPDDTGSYPDDTGSYPDDMASVADIPGYDELTPEQQAQAQAMAAELAEARQRLMEVPAAEVVANHAMGLYELAAIHLGNQPPNLDEANVAIDAMNALVGAMSGRLGENEAVLREALQQLQLAFVQLTNAEGGMEQ